MSTVEFRVYVEPNGGSEFSVTGPAMYDDIRRLIEGRLNPPIPLPGNGRVVAFDEAVDAKSADSGSPSDADLRFEILKLVLAQRPSGDPRLETEALLRYVRDGISKSPPPTQSRQPEDCSPAAAQVTPPSPQRGEAA